MCWWRAMGGFRPRYGLPMSGQKKPGKNRPAGACARTWCKFWPILQPGFMRFPGGCIVKAPTCRRRYQWKKTLGPVRAAAVAHQSLELRVPSTCPAPDYFPSPLALASSSFSNCARISARNLCDSELRYGVPIQLRRAVCPLDRLDPYIQDALDLIEFCQRPVTSEWGAKRSELGHPSPFKMKMMGVGNEQWGPNMSSVTPGSRKS